MTTEEKKVYSGHCPCGTTTWSTTVPPGHITYCYCVACRKDSNAPFIAFTSFPISQLTWHPENLKTSGSKVAIRAFCTECDALMSMQYFCRPGWQSIVMRGEGGEGFEHIFVGEKDEGYDIPEDGLTRWETFDDGFRVQLEKWMKEKKGEESG